MLYLSGFLYSSHVQKETRRTNCVHYFKTRVYASDFMENHLKILKNSLTVKKKCIIAFLIVSEQMCMQYYAIYECT